MDNFKINSNISSRIEVLRFPLIYGVVLLHNRAFFWKEELNDSFNVLNQFLQYLFTDVLLRTVVPCFLFIAGFLFFNSLNFSFQIYLKKVQSRLFTLVIPYFLWNGIALLNGIIVYKWAETLSIWDFLWLLYNGNNSGMPVNYPLWFIRDLIIMVILSPLLWFALKYLPYISLIVLAVLWFADTPPLIVPVLWASPLFFYAGGLARTQKWDLSRLDRFILPLSIIYLVLASIIAFYLTTHQNFNPIVFKLVLLLGIITVWLLTARVANTKIEDLLIRLSGFAFFLYCSHALIADVLGNAFIKSMKPISSLENIFFYFCFPILVTIIAIAIATTVHKISPRVYRLLNGGRGYVN